MNSDEPQWKESTPLDTRAAERCQGGTAKRTGAPRRFAASPGRIVRSPGSVVNAREHRVDDTDRSSEKEEGRQHVDGRLVRLEDGEREAPGLLNGFDA